ncbi:hypothetical protein F5Y16DRAFT_388698 [Xylariaceae sp. FL0255]|nr:hypothetical protein F5Y16DRAFT_388698 [Xylariaceae sp. FL0255]
MTKLLTVFGATGQQGGALIGHILATQALSSEFTLRGITRDASKAAAQELKKKGVEIVEADLNVPSTLAKAVAGSWAVFGVTNFWEEPREGLEVAQGKAIADAAVAAGAHQIIWSSLPHVSEMTKGAITSMKHFDGKAEVESYIRTLDIKSMFFHAGWFMQNHLTLMRPKQVEDATYVLSMPWGPSAKLPLIDIRDAGRFIAPALLDPNRYNRKRFACATANYTISEMIATWTKVTGKPLKLDNPKSTASYTGLSEEQKEETAAVVKLGEYGYFGPDGDLELSWTIEQVGEHERLTTWEQFLRDHEPWFS